MLGEESTSQGTSRFVDSSVERVQVKVKGLSDGKYILTCNNRRVPLSPTGVKEEWVGGVRYKAWDPPSAMHPTIGAHSRLVFDLVDVRNKKSLGGCVHHVSHPGGRSYETFPVNAREAESRRLSRFWEDGHTPGIIDPVAVSERPSVRFEVADGGRIVTEIPREEVSLEFPNTLDLRSSSLSIG